MSQTGFLMVRTDAMTGTPSITVKFGLQPFRNADYLAPQCPLFGDHLDPKSRKILRHAIAPVLCITAQGEIIDILQRSPWPIRVATKQPGLWATAFADPASPDGTLHLQLERRLDNALDIVRTGFDLPASAARIDSSGEEESYRRIHAEECRAAGPRDSRMDRRDHLIFTIDNDDTRDIDDALEIKEIRKDRHYILGIHIADVTAFIAPDSPRDRDARQRSTSHYLADTVLHMLPECLSAGLCSLLPGEDRLAFSIYLELVIQDGRPIIKGSRIFPSVIRSRHKMAYSQVNAMFEKALHEGPESPLLGVLREALDIARVLRAARPTGPARINDHGSSGELIEHFMIYANHFIGQQMASTLAALPQSRGTAIFRRQPGPETSHLLHLAAGLIQAGFMPHVTEQELLAAARSRKEKEYLPSPSSNEDSAMFRSALHREILARTCCEDETTLDNLTAFLQQAGEGGLNKAGGLTTRPELSGHHDLGISRYAWFTSPIRRYPDMVNHRFLKQGKRQRLSEQDVQTMQRRIADGRRAQYALGDLRDAAELIQRGALVPDKITELVVLKFRAASPLQTVITAQVAGLNITIRIRDNDNVSIRQEPPACHLTPPGRPPVVLTRGGTAGLLLHAGNIVPEAGCVLVNTDQWNSLAGGKTA